MAVLLRFRNFKATNITTKRCLSDYFAEQKAVEHHAKKTAFTWKWASLLVALPTCGFLAYKNLVVGEEHHHHDWIPYDHLRIRKVQFPWGPESLFHSKHNPGPHQNVEEDEEKPSEPKENPITAWLRKKQEERLKHSQKLLMESIAESHQSMMEHIEKKKLPHFIHFPTYAELFGYRKHQIHDETTRLPATFDD